MHRASPSLRIPLPRLDAGLTTNLLCVGALVAFCVILSIVTWWWTGAMLGCLLTFAGSVYVQRNLLVADDVVPENVAPIKKSA